MKALVIYDTTGKIWNIVYGTDESPEGMPSMFVEIPNYAQLERIDVETDPENHTPVFVYMPDNNVGQLEAEMKVLRDENAELKANNARLEEEITNLQLAIVELYEGTAGNVTEEEAVVEESTEVEGGTQ